MKKLMSSILAISILTSGLSCFANTKTNEETNSTQATISNEKKAEKTPKNHSVLKFISRTSSIALGTLVGSMCATGINILTTRIVMNKALKELFAADFNGSFEFEEENAEEQNIEEQNN